MTRRIPDDSTGLLVGIVVVFAVFMFVVVTVFMGALMQKIQQDTPVEEVTIPNNLTPQPVVDWDNYPKYYIYADPDFDSTNRSHYVTGV